MTYSNDLISPAYIDNGSDYRGYTHDGLTKREHFAAMADGSDVHEYSIDTLAKIFNLPPFNKDNDAEWIVFMAKAEAAMKVLKADALIESLNKATGKKEEP